MGRLPRMPSTVHKLDDKACNRDALQRTAMCCERPPTALQMSVGSTSASIFFLVTEPALLIQKCTVPSCCDANRPALPHLLAETRHSALHAPGGVFSIFQVFFLLVTCCNPAVLIQKYAVPSRCSAKRPIF